MWSVSSRQYSVCIYLATIVTLFSLHIQIECCSLNTFDMITLMHQNPNYQNDPCYIQWQAVENAKLADIWAKRAKLEESIRESNRKQREYDARMRQDREHENQQRMNSISSAAQTAEAKTGNGSVFGYLAIIGFVVAFLCCLVCISQSENENGTETNIPRTNLQQNEILTSQITSIIVSNGSGIQTVYSSTSTENNSHSRQESDTTVPLKPRRQDSLPSYEDAVKMPSAPLIE